MLSTFHGIIDPLKYKLQEPGLFFSLSERSQDFVLVVSQCKLLVLVSKQNI